ncbi:MAG: hypothetical protein FWC50_10460 [Planctomycetaceae bacterium]|nr:hypothetical protein [Planctomycetaceae bacterium]
METTLNKVNPDQETWAKNCRFKWWDTWWGFIVTLIVFMVIAEVISSYSSYIRPPQPISPKPGTTCIVRFRPDVIGGSYLAPRSIHNSIGDTVNTDGTLIAVDREAILLEVDNTEGKPQKKQLWIPKSNILLIEYKKCLSTKICG